MLPAPNLYVGNPKNGHGHVYYALAAPVGIGAAHRRAPLEFAAAVQRGMVRRLGADRAYANRFAKNPQHPSWRESWYRPRAFELRELYEGLGPRDTPPFAKSLGPTGLSRNCDLFGRVRLMLIGRLQLAKVWVALAITGLRI